MVWCCASDCLLVGLVMFGLGFRLCDFVVSAAGCYYGCLAVLVILWLRYMGLVSTLSCGVIWCFWYLSSRFALVTIGI